MPKPMFWKNIGAPSTAIHAIPESPSASIQDVEGGRDLTCIYDKLRDDLDIIPHPWLFKLREHLPLLSLILPSLLAWAPTTVRAALRSRSERRVQRIFSAKHRLGQVAVRVCWRW